jgi:hypothetical protein
MSDLLIVFVVLLVLLTLISTLGGSIYPKEYFEEQVREKFWEEEETKEQEPLVEPQQDDSSAPEPFYQEKVENYEDKEETPVEHFKQEEDIVEGFDGDMYAGVNY